MTRETITTASVVLKFPASPWWMPEVLALRSDSAALSTPASERDDELVEARGGPEMPDRWITAVRHATLSVHRPHPALATGTAVVICPGGGYFGVSYDREGTYIARWLNGLGVTACVLKYRVPVPTEVGLPAPRPLIDAALAVDLIRTHAGRWSVDPARVGLMGFSAGGHLAAITGAAPLTVSPDRLARPDFLILGYPVISFTDEALCHKGSRELLLGAGDSAEVRAAYSPDLRVTPATPPTFLFHAADDKAVPIGNSYVFRDACRRHGVAAELVEFATGNHGFGIGQGECAAWPDAAAAWMRGRGLLG